MRGPGRGKRGRDIPRLGKTCPADLGEWLFCQGMEFMILPGDLEAGVSLDGQPMDTWLRFHDLVGFYESEKERLTVLQQKRTAPKGRR